MFKLLLVNYYPFNICRQFHYSQILLIISSYSGLSRSEVSTARVRIFGCGLLLIWFWLVLAGSGWFWLVLV